MPNWRKMLGGLFVAALVSTQGSAMAEQLIDPNNPVPRDLLSVASNMSSALVICYLWYSDSKRKDDMLKNVLESHSQQSKAIIEEMSRMVPRP